MECLAGTIAPQFPRIVFPTHPDIELDSGHHRRITGLSCYMIASDEIISEMTCVFRSSKGGGTRSSKGLPHTAPNF